MDVLAVTETELAVMRCLWEQGDATNRQVAQALYDNVSDPKLSSAQKLLERLEWKGCVKRDRAERPHRFRPTLTREAFSALQVQGLADKLYEGSLTPILTSLVQSGGVSKSELSDLQKLIDEHSNQLPRKKTRVSRKPSQSQKQRRPKR